MKFLSETLITKKIIENSKYLLLFLPLFFLPVGFEFFETPKYYLILFFSLFCLLSLQFKRLNINNWVTVSLFIFILINLISSVQIFFKESFYGLEFLRYGSILFYFSLFFILLFLTQKKLPKNFLSMNESYLLVGIFIASVLGILQFLISPFNLLSLDWYFDGRIVSTLGHPNFLASVIVVGLLILQRNNLPWVKATLILALILTFSKVSIIIYFLYSFLSYIKKIYYLNKKIAITLLLVFTIFCSSVVLGLFTNSYEGLISGRPELYQVQRFFVFLDPKELSLDLRFVLWQEALDAIKDSPYFGFGKGQIARVIYIDREDDLLVTSTHNLFLDIAVESGILGLITFLFFIVFSLKSTYNFQKELFTVQCFILIHGFFDITSVILWFLFIFITALSLNRSLKTT